VLLLSLSSGSPESTDPANRHGPTCRIGMLIAMADNDVEIPNTQLGIVGVKLSTPMRITAFVLGIAGLGAGGVAVFITHLEAGPVGLMAVGLIFMIIALGGVLPTRLKVGENEATWEVERKAVETFVARVAEGAPANSQAELLDALGDLAEKAPEVAARGMSAVAYEQQLRAEIENVLRDLEGSSGSRLSHYMTDIGASRQRVDAVVETPSGRLIPIEMRISEKTLQADSIEALDYRQKSLALQYSNVLLFITRTPVSPAAWERLQRYPEIHHVVYRGPQDREALKQALREVIAG
jgi:hypothetical protein